MSLIPPAMAESLGYHRKGNRLSVGWLGTYIMSKAAHGKHGWPLFLKRMQLIGCILGFIHAAQPIWQHIVISEHAIAADVLVSVLVFIIRWCT